MTVELVAQCIFWGAWGGMVVISANLLLYSG